MKKLFTLIVLVAATYFAVPANAQLKFGIKGGLNITDMSLSNDVFETSNRTGFFIGPTIKFTLPIVGLGIDASALYDQREGEVNVEADDNTLVSTRLKQKSINIPINLRYDIGLGSLAAVYLAAGPQFGFNVGDKNQSLYKDVAEWRLNTSNFSVNVGAGVMLLGHLQVGANYNIVCGKTGEITVLDGAESVLRGQFKHMADFLLPYYFLIRGKVL